MGNQGPDQGYILKLASGISDQLVLAPGEHAADVIEGAWPILSASAKPYFPHSRMPKQMDRDDMDSVKADFVRAAVIADKASFYFI